MSFQRGARLGHYEILSSLGAGGMGEVYRARDTALGREVAIKALPDRIAGDPQARARFAREAQTLASLKHPHIATLYGVETAGDASFLVMELVEGETLAARLARGPLPLREALDVAEQIAGALDRAHRHGIVHRDLKPGNVMLSRDGVKLLDFGLAKSFRGGEVESDAPTLAAPLTRAGTLVGTPSYMAPEQVEGRSTDARTDVFALGAVRYEMVTGQRAFTGESTASVIAAILRSEPAPLGEALPGAPAALEGVVRRCLAKNPDQRWQSAHDVALALGLVAAESRPAGTEALASPWSGARPPGSRRPL